MYNIYGSLGYSSGESAMATSDAQNVDYGLPVDNKKQVSAKTVNDSNSSSDKVVYNNVKESRVSDFGVVWYPFAAPMKRKEKAIPTAIRPSRGTASINNGPTRGTFSGGGMSGTSARPTDAILQTFGTLDGQNEAVISKFYVGQL